MSELAAIDKQSGKYQEAESILRNVIDIRRRVQGPENAMMVANLSDLSLTYTLDKKFAEAESLNRQAVEMGRRILGPESAFTLDAMDDLGFLYLQEQKYAAAEPILAQTLQGMTKVLGPAHPKTLQVFGNLIFACSEQGKFSRVVSLWQQDAAGAPQNAAVLNDAAWAMLTVPDVGARRPADALEIARRLVTISPNNADYENTLGLAEVRNGLWDDAIAALDQCVKGHNGTNATDFLFLAMAHQGRGDKAEAEKNYARGAEMASKTAANNAELTMLWSEAAKDLGQPGPPEPKPEKPHANP
jgi:tetratricopeptide (TPR) repeat protein